jgi:hypothetical protein
MSIYFPAASYLFFFNLIQNFPSNWVWESLFNLIYKIIVYFEHIRNTCFSHNIIWVWKNYIRKVCETLHYNFIDWIKKKKKKTKKKKNYILQLNLDKNSVPKKFIHLHALSIKPAFRTSFRFSILTVHMKIVKYNIYIYIGIIKKLNIILRT